MFSDDGAGLVSQVTSSESYYYLADGLGSTMVTVDSDGDVVNEYTYDVFGATRSESGAQANEFQFAGQQVDGSTGLQYLRARYYDVETGRFISREPLTAAISWSGNSFAYSNADPVGRIDPMGTKPVDANGCEFANGACHKSNGWHLKPDAPLYSGGVWLEAFVDVDGGWNLRFCTTVEHAFATRDCTNGVFDEPIQLLAGEVCTVSGRQTSAGTHVVHARCSKGGQVTQNIFQEFDESGWWPYARSCVAGFVVGASKTPGSWTKVVGGVGACAGAVLLKEQVLP
ncbi:MAG: RHS repeat-associated core domain-containing protein [Dehalococcoidia bacterium]